MKKHFSIIKKNFNERKRWKIIKKLYAFRHAYDVEKTVFLPFHKMRVCETNEA